MQIPIIPFRGQKKPWGSVPRINWAHPLTRNLLYYGYDTGCGKIVDLVRTVNLTVTTGTVAGPRPSQFGSGNKYAAGAGYFSPSIYPWTLGQSTVATAWFMTANPSVAFTCPFGFSNSPGSSLASFLLDASNVLDVQFSVNNVNPTAVVVNSLNAFHTAVGVSTGATSQILYFDGKNVSNGALTDNAQTAMAADFNSITNTTTPSQNGFNGWVYYGALWSRQLSQIETLQLHLDPWCFLIYPEDEVFATLVGVAAAATSEDRFHQPWSSVGRRYAIIAAG